MYKPIDPFIEILPQLDVHGHIMDTLMVEVNAFINENIKKGNKKIVIIHGKGSGILKNKLHEELKKNNKVSNFYLYNMNIGCTIIELK